MRRRSATPEGVIVETFKDALRALSLLLPLFDWTRVHVDGVRTSGGRRRNPDMVGFTDFEVVYNGRVGYIEFKSDKGIVSAEQVAFMSRRQLAGCKVLVARSYEEGIEFLINEMGVPIDGGIKRS